MSTLVICWDADAVEWVVLDDGGDGVELERFDHLLDAGWFVQSEERRVS